MPPQPVELHVDTAATVDISIHPSALPPDAVPGDLVAVRPVLSPSSKGKGRDKPLLYKVEKTADADDAANVNANAGGGGGDAGLVGLATATRRRGKAQVIVSPMLAQSYSWVKTRTEVELSLIPAPPPAGICATHVELYFNNMYLSRPDSFALTLSLADKVLHTGQRVALPGSGARLRVGDMYTSISSSPPSLSKKPGARRGSSSHAKNTRVDAAYITDETKFVFRSESARCYVFIEMSQEMWHFEEDGSMLLEKCELFLQELFLHYSGKMSPDAEDKRSKGIPTSHVVSIVLYGRVIYDDAQDGEEERAPLSRLDDGTLYRDFYKVILDLTPSPPKSIIHDVALELRRWQSTVFLRTRPDGSQKLSGRLANAHESPVLEAMNLALNSFEEHWIDRDLQRTNLEILILTAGTSYYHVEKNLLRLTTERMLYHGIGLDLISLSKMPLHTVPLFQFRSPDPIAAETTFAANDSGILTSKSTTAVSFGRSPMTTGLRLGASNATSNAFQPSSLRQAASFPASPPLRDPLAPDAASTTASHAPSRFVPVHVPDDQRDPLYFDPPPAPHSEAVQHARMASASIGLPSPSLNSVASAPAGSATPKVPPAPAPPTALETSLYYMEPGFVFPHFFGTQIDKPHRIDRFMPRARCYELATQGVTERMPISIPLLSLGANIVADSVAFLSEAEKRQLKRDRYDAMAVGAPDPAQLSANGAMAQWAEVRESGATTGTSGTSGTGSSGHGDGSAWSVKEDRDAEARAAHEERDEAAAAAARPALSPLMVPAQTNNSSRAALGRGQPVTAILSPQSSTSSLDTSDSSRRESVSTDSSSDATVLSRSESADDEADADRGRLTAREVRCRRAQEDASLGRSKTPIARRSSQGRHGRSSSVSGSVRTISSATSKPSTANGASPSLASRKASTPALIARLTGALGSAPPSSAASTPAAPPPLPSSSSSSRPSWLNLFGRSHAPATTSSPLAAPVAVARIDVQASLKPDDSDHDDDATSETPVLGYSSATHRSTSRNKSRPDDARSTTTNGRTQPIAIGSSMSTAGSTSGATADKGHGRSVGTNGNVGSLDKHAGQMSSSLKAYEPGAAFRRAMGISGGKISVASKFNPSKPGKRSVGLADQTRRSITRGACLPITTDYLPSADVLQSQYSEYRYSVPTNAVTTSFLLRTDHPKRSHVLTLITELICQRLSHGFQICTPVNAVGALDAINMATSKTLPDVLRDIQDGEVTAIYLSLANQIHRIAYDRRTQSVFVKVLRRRRTWAKTDYAYKALVWTRGTDNYDMSHFVCPYPAMVEPIDWQYCDRLVAGAEKPDVQRSVRYRRTRLVLLPAKKVPDRDYIISANKALQRNDVSDAMIQAQGFRALMDLIEGVRWAPTGLEKEPLSITQTTLDAPGWATSMAQQQQQNGPSGSPSTAPVAGRTPRANWLSRMQARPAHSFSGRTGLLPTSPRFDADLDLPPAPLPPPAKTAAALLARTDTSASVPVLPKSSSMSTSMPGSPAMSMSSLPPIRRPVVQMTHAVVLDLDAAKRSDRSERVLCHLDRSHNVAAAYHIELAWLTASGKVVDNVIQTWTRQTARYGLTLIEVSMRAVLDRHNPFQKPTVVKPVVLPTVPNLSDDSSDEEEDGAGDLSAEDKTAVGTYLQELALARVLRSLDFFLDLGADSTFPSDIDVEYSYRRTPTVHSQYIHRSGTVLVSIFPDEDDPAEPGRLAIACSPNRIWTSHHPELDSQEPLRRLREVCADANELQRLYGELGQGST
ncbi:vacuolar membrane-associated protein iml1 [Rhodotorula mucilaginosa]|uniref:Vacuolar membrane-associated protein iml1 n=1 Tax=Rhodotorula mucilaginosa TaxID=5537 RepID=A0A9P6WAA1_RHOMI|nr:vacuolar membrane-associated protein iml1 [Rhodotorula mucilaginosa]